MKIGIIGPSDSGCKIKDYLNEIDSTIETKLYIKEKADEAIDVIELCEKECTAIIFTGVAVAEAVKSNYIIKLPNATVSRGGTSLTKAFWQVKSENKSLDRFSIDIVEDEVIDDVLKEIDISPKSVYSLPFSSNIKEAEYEKWHLDLYKENKIDVILTSFGAIYNDLKKQGYPVYRIEATRPLIKVCYEKLKTKYALNKAQNSQLAVEILNLANYKGDKDNYYTNMLKKSELDKIIVEYVRSIQGSLFNFGRDEYIIFAHRGAIDNDDNYNKLFKLQKDIKSSGFSLCVGIGIGNTAYQAESNAYNSLKRSLDSSDFEIYLIDENEVIKGPLGSDVELSYSLVASDENVLNISQNTGLSGESIAKIMAISKTRQSKVYDTKELADYLNISDRSARRILNKLVETNFARVYAKETSKGGGRPKNLIEVLF